ncbi:MAG: DUF2852 domain-containing protein [Hyphomicrobium sp.]
MPLLFLGFVLVTFLWLLWAIAWVVVWGVALLAWSLAIVLGAVAVLRAVTRNRLRFAGARAEAPLGERSSVRSGNAAFDEYRAETLRKVADEQRGFREFLERLRRSKDKQEFDRFMADRRAAPSTGPQRSLPAV